MDLDAFYLDVLLGLHSASTLQNILVLGLTAPSTIDALALSLSLPSKFLTPLPTPNGPVALLRLCFEIQCNNNYGSIAEGICNGLFSL